MQRTQTNNSTQIHQQHLHTSQSINGHNIDRNRYRYQTCRIHTKAHQCEHNEFVVYITIKQTYVWIMYRLHTSTDIQANVQWSLDY